MGNEPAFAFKAVTHAKSRQMSQSNQKAKGVLYLIPVPLGEHSLMIDSLPAVAIARAAQLDYFIVERAKTARAFIKQTGIQTAISELKICELNEHSPAGWVQELLKPLLRGQDAGLMSEAGCPAVADPGADLVAAAHQAGIAVVPLIGPSSIMLTLMASGLNGQRFAFEGYLPTDKSARELSLRELEQRSWQLKQTQLWIETPYRSRSMAQSALSALKGSTRLAIACDVSLASELIQMKSIEQWQQKPPSIEKRLTVFALLA